MPGKKHYSVYLMTSFNRRLYVGVTNNLLLRVRQHKSQSINGFASRYNLTQLVYYEQFDNVLDAIAREKQIKGWARAKKLALIESLNPDWVDLADSIPVD